MVRPKIDINLPELPFEFRKNNNRTYFSEDLMGWQEEIVSDIHRRIDLIRSKKEFNSLILDMLTLDEHIARTPKEIDYIGQLLARTEKREMDLKRAIKKAEGNAYFKYKESEYMKGNKKPTKDEFEHYIAIQPEVEEAHNELADNRQTLVTLQYYQEALQQKQRMLSTMLAKQRDIIRSEGSAQAWV